MHVAIVSYGFPPMRHVAGVRAARMAQALAARGHRVTVITVDWRPHPEPGAAKDDDGVDGVRIDPRAWYPGFSPSTPPFVVDAPPQHSLRRRARTAMRVLRWGPYAPWAKRGLVELTARHRQRPVDVVWAIHGDASAHEIAYRFHRAERVPWVADFKDPWDLFATGAVARTLTLLATMRRVRSAAAVTETSDGQARVDRARFARPTFTVPSGYDAALMARADPTRLAPTFTLVHVGHLSVQHDRDALARTLAVLRARGSAVTLHLVGHRSADLDAIFAKHGVSASVVHHPFVDQAAAYALMRGADALLLMPATHFAPSGASVGVKELELMASGSPVLCLGRPLAEMEPIVRALPQVAVATSPEDAARTLDAWARGGSTRGELNAPPVAAFDWAACARALEDVLRRATGAT